MINYWKVGDKIPFVLMTDELESDTKIHFHDYTDCWFGDLDACCDVCATTGAENTWEDEV
jgi:hypothetical protein